jgi:hypothetical protein
MNLKISSFKVLAPALLLVLCVVCPFASAEPEQLRDESGRFQPVITLAEANRRAELEAETLARSGEGEEVAKEPNRKTYLEKVVSPKAAAVPVVPAIS